MIESEMDQAADLQIALGTILLRRLIRYARTVFQGARRAPLRFCVPRLS